MTTKPLDAETFAHCHFGGCEAHAAEARDVFRAIEAIHGSGLDELKPDLPLRDLLERDPADDSLDAIELELALELDLGGKNLHQRALRALPEEAVMKALLGPVAAMSSWDPTTIWARSPRGVINERVRLGAGHCSCGDVRTRWS